MDLTLKIDPDEELTLDRIQQFIDTARSMGVEGTQALAVISRTAGRDMGGERKGSDWCEVVASA